MHNKIHDLHMFMSQVSRDMAEEYERISMRATEDPGTAGDQGEENWAELLRDWLPGDYHIETKGRIIGANGEPGPQVDILVLHSTYPKKLRKKKVYLAAGVAAAFECKTTIKTSHIKEAFQNSVKIKKLYEDRQGSPYKELHSPLIYGLLAHSHNWKAGGSSPVENISNKIRSEDLEQVNHPKLGLDILCVADLGTWNLIKLPFFAPITADCDWETMKSLYGEMGSAVTCYMGHTSDTEEQSELTKPIGVLISYLSQKLAWENTALRGLADYYRKANIGGIGQGTSRTWPMNFYSENVRAKLLKGEVYDDIFIWDEWAKAYT